MSKLERKFLAHFINVGEDGYEFYERLGKDLEEFSPQLQAQVQTKKNILGQTDVVISGYEKTAAVESYYADVDTNLFRILQNIIDSQLTMDALETDVLEVHLWQPADEGGYEAWKEKAYIEVTSYGGDTTGYQIPFTLHFTGDRVQGVYNPDSGEFIQR